MKQMVRRFSFALLAAFTLAGIGMTINVSQAAAVSGSDWRAGRIIDDSIFTNANAMTAGQIQDFLNARVPTCDNWGTQSYGGTTRRAYSESRGVTFPLTCLKDYFENPDTHANNLSGNPIPGGGKSAAQLISDVSHQYSINPQVIITLLQKEQGLVMDDWPWPTQFQKATGYGCPDTAPCDSQYYGFYNQISNAARQFRAYQNHPDWFNYVPNATNAILFNPNNACGNSGVYIQSEATAALYNYTPYQPNAAALNNLYGTGDGCSAYGNRNFWRMFNDWFGTTVAGAEPSPLYKSDTNPTIYAVADGKKYPVPDYGVMSDYGYHRYGVAIVSDDFLASYATQSPLTNLAKKQNDPSGTIYFFDDGKRYPVSIQNCKQNPDGSTVANSNWKLDCFNSSAMLALPNQLIDLYTVQDIPLPQVILNNNAAWKVEDGKKRRITDGAFVGVLGGWGNVRWMKDNNVTMAEGQLLIPDNSTVKFSDSPTIFFLTNTKLRPAMGPGEYASWNLGARNTYNLPSAYNAPAPLSVGSVLHGCAQGPDGQYYLLTLNGTKVSLSGSESNWVLDATTCSDATANALAAIPTVPNTGVYRAEDGSIFTVFNKYKYIFPTSDDFYNLGFRPEQITNVSEQIVSSLTYGGMHMSSGRLFKVQGSDQIRIVSGSLSLTVDSTNYPGLPYNKLITVDSTTAARYPVAGAFHP